MAAAEDRKRRYPVDSSESDIQLTRQPPKKRFLSSTPTSPTSNQAVDMDNDQQGADDPNDPFKVFVPSVITPNDFRKLTAHFPLLPKNQIVHYQKDAIHRQTCEYRVSYLQRTFKESFQSNSFVFSELPDV